MATSPQTAINKSLLASHLIRFVGYNAGLSLLPLVASLLVRWLGEVSAPSGVYAAELLFFSVAVSATAFGDLTDEKYTEGIKWLFDLLKIVLLLEILLAAMLFGVTQYDSIISTTNTKLRDNSNSSGDRRRHQNRGW